MTVSSPAVRSAALALVSIAAALAFGRVFADGGFAGPLIVAAVVPHAVGWVGRVRSWPLARTALLGGPRTALALVWITAGASTFFGIPTAETVTRVAHLLDHGWAVFRTGIAPVPPTPGVVLLCAVTVGAVAVTADTIARRPDTTIAALAPTLVLFVLTGTLGTDDLRLPTTIAYVAAALVELTIAERMHGWKRAGRGSPGDGSRRMHPSSAARCSSAAPRSSSAWCSHRSSLASTAVRC